MIAPPSADEDDNPFAPGTGHTPEHVAGREEEFALLSRALLRIDKSKVQDGLLKRASMPPLVLTGPRGVGKKLLLRLMQKRAQEMDIHVARLEHVKDLTPGDALANLFGEIAGDDESLLKLVKGIKLSFAGFGAGADLREASSSYKQVLQARLRKGPVALLMDEAHHYEAKYMGVILQVGQRLITEQHPLVMLLAGTPDLRSYLMNIEATFMARSERIYINLLATDESKSGLSKPFANRGIEVEPEALEMMWGMTDNYPYFVQLVGSEIWEALPEKGKQRVDVALVEKAREGISHKRRDFYSLLYEEMDNEDLTSYALQAAEVITRQQGAPVKKKDIRLALLQENSALKAEKARKIIDRLQRLGFIWQGEEGQMEAGIPSFFTYLQEMEQGTLK